MVKLSREYKGFIFDCDGTLADSMKAHYDSWVQALNENGATFHLDLDLFLSTGGMGLSPTVHYLNQKFNNNLDADKVCNRKVELFEEMVHLVTPKEEVVHFLKSIHGKFPTAVASGNSRSSVIKTLNHLGITDLFNVIITQEDVKNGKPNPEIFLLAASKIGVEPKDALVFEDAPMGYAAAKSAGMDYYEVL